MTGESLQKEKLDRYTLLIWFGAIIAPFISAFLVKFLELLHVLESVRPAIKLFGNVPILLFIILLPSYVLLFLQKRNLLFHALSCVAISLMFGLLWNFLMLYYAYVGCSIFHDC